MEQITVQAIGIRLDALEKRLCTVEQTPAQTEQAAAQMAVQSRDQAPVVLGFRLVQKTTRTAGKAYVKWYAVKGNAVVYVGSDAAIAESKIAAYLEKRKA